MPHYYLDLEARRREVYEFPEENLAKLMREAGAKAPEDLQDFDCRIFDDEDEAFRWLEEFEAKLARLPRVQDRPPNTKPMLLKRRYLPQVLMGVKMYTLRTWFRPWPAGTLVTFHDQTFGVTVRLTSVTRTPEGYWRYDYTNL